MQITDIKFEAYRWPRTKPITNGLYTYTHAGLNAIIVETDENVQGLGLTTDLVSANIISAIVEGLKPALIGKDPFDNERHWHEMWRPKLVGRRGLTTRAIGGIDIALWDIK